MPCLELHITDYFCFAETEKIITHEVTDLCFPQEKINYDYLGRRVEKKIFTKTNGTLSYLNSFRYIYDGFKCVARYASNDDSTYQLDRKYLWNGEQLLIVFQDNSMTPYFPITDANKNITDYIDKDGNPAAHYEYSPFGRIIDEDGAISNRFAYRFSSEVFDSKSALIYYNYRYYSPELGRWLSRDPIEENGGANLYAMVANDPVNMWDVLGMGKNGKCIYLFRGADIGGTGNNAMAKGTKSMLRLARKAREKGYIVVFKKNVSSETLDDYLYSNNKKFTFAFIYSHGSFDLGALPSYLLSSFETLDKAGIMHTYQFSASPDINNIIENYKKSAKFFGSDEYKNSINLFEINNIHSYLLLKKGVKYKIDKGTDNGPVYILSCWSRFLFTKGAMKNMHLVTINNLTTYDRRKIQKSTRGNYRIKLNVSLDGLGNPHKLESSVIGMVVDKLIRKL